MSSKTWWDNHCNIDEFRQMVNNNNELSRIKVRDYIGSKGKVSVLDCGAGLCEDWFKFKESYPEVSYNAIDFTEKFCIRNKKYGINIERASIEAIPKPNNSFDIVYCRHVLEHLPHFHTALSEMIRVAKKEVVVTFFIRPAEEEKIFADENGLNTNTYSKKDIEYALGVNDKVIGWEWELFEEDEEILYISL